MRAGLLMLLLLASLCTQAQEAKRGYWWPLRQNTSLLFVNEQPVLQTGVYPLSTFEICTGFADVNGNPQVATNGLRVVNGNGDTLRYVSMGLYGGFFHNPQSTILLPVPETSDSAVLLYWDRDGRINYSLFPTNHNPNDTNKVAVVRNMTDSVAYKLIPIRHGNGRDWWVVTRAANTNTWLRYLVTRQGVQGPWHQGGVFLGSSLSAPNDDSQAIYNESWQRIFSTSFPATPNDTTNIRSWGFDRWTGMLCCEDSIGIPLPYNTGAISGLSLSPSSRYLYCTESDFAPTGYNRLLRIDLYSNSHPNILVDSRFNDGETLGRIQNYTMCEGPDGRLYMSLFTRNQIDTLSRYLGVIEMPDDSLNCRFNPKGLYVGLQNVHAVGLPFMPDYTLGVSTTPAGVAKGQAAVQSALRVYPNPSQGGANVLYELPTGQTATLSLTDVSGRCVWQAHVACSGTIALPQAVSAGVYHISLQSESSVSSLPYIVTP